MSNNIIPKLDFIIADNAKKPHIGIHVAAVDEDGELGEQLASWPLPTDGAARAQLEDVVIATVEAANNSLAQDLRGLLSGALGYCQGTAEPHAQVWAQLKVALDKLPVKYYLGKLVERNGEDKYTHTVRFMTDRNPMEYLDTAASRFYDADGAQDGDEYWHKGGTVTVRAASVREVPKDFYVLCHEFDAVPYV